MAENIVQVTEGSGKKLHTWDTTIGANLVQDEFVIPAEYPYPTYSMPFTAVSIATAADHIICINAGASLKVKITRIYLVQDGNATAVAATRFEVMRTTTGAPTGGTAVTALPFDTSAAAAGAAGRTLPGVKGTEAAVALWPFMLVLRQAPSATASNYDGAYEWVAQTNEQRIVIPTGTTNGLVIKNVSARAGATVSGHIEFIETAF